MNPIIPASVHSIALLLALCVQWSGTPLAGAWFIFHCAGCVLLLYNGKYPKEKDPIWWASITWLIALCLSTFIIAPTNGAGQTVAFLAAMPTLALCLRKEHLPAYCSCFLAVFTLYGLGLIIQEIIGVQYTSYNVDDRRAWPLMDPNNAAAVVNMALIPCLYAFIMGRRSIFPHLCAILAAALWTTGSIAGGTVAAGSLLVFICSRYGWRAAIIPILFSEMTAIFIHIFHPDKMFSLLMRVVDRFEIWQGSWIMLWGRPWGGLGLGSFGFYYKMVRTEMFSAGYFAHNDLLQLAIEMGIPCAMTLLALILTVIATTCRNNIVSACVVLAIVAQSMSEMQLYLPSISLGIGLALAAHRFLPEKKRKAIDLR